MPISKTTGKETTHASTVRGGAKKKIHVPDCESLVRFAETMRLRSLADATREEYLRFVRKLAARCGGDPSTLDEAAVRAHLLRLKDEHHYSPSSMRTAVSAMRAFFGLHLGREWKLFDLVRSPSAQKLPTVLTREEVARLFAVVRVPRFLTLFRLIYACGLRIGDGARQRGDGHAEGVARSGAEGMARGCPRSGQRAMQLGFVGVLHTWGRQLQHHPHVHYIVPGGGLSEDGKKWIAARQRDWLLPVAKLAAVFARRMEEAVRAEAPAWHAAAPAGTWRRHWSVHSQPAGSGENATSASASAVVRYLARYVGRTAISDERIVAADDERVTFRYTDSATQQRRLCTLSAAEFLRRYLQHVPPAGQHRVRYFGWMHPSAKRRRMQVETLLQKPIVVATPPPESPRWHLRCPHCERFTLVRVGALPRQARAPPTLTHSSPPRCTR